jgi:hypothetical protein
VVSRGSLFDGILGGSHDSCSGDSVRDPPVDSSSLFNFCVFLGYVTGRAGRDDTSIAGMCRGMSRQMGRWADSTASQQALRVLYCISLLFPVHLPCFLFPPVRLPSAFYQINIPPSPQDALVCVLLNTPTHQPISSPTTQSRYPSPDISTPTSPIHLSPTKYIP